MNLVRWQLFRAIGSLGSLQEDWLGMHVYK